MKSGLTIREDNYASVLDALKQLSSTDVLVGIPADKAERRMGHHITTLSWVICTRQGPPSQSLSTQQPFIAKWMHMGI